MTDYGYFDDSHREYVITNPKTPVKWINYIGTIAFGGFVDHTGGILLCKGDPALNRITRYIPQLPASDFKGATLYVRIKQAQGYRIFSAFFTPTLEPYQRYECHVGLGYSRIISEFYQLRTEAVIFVPRNGDRIIQDITITNLSGEPLEIDLIPVVEYSHPDALKQFTNADWVPQTMQSKLVAQLDGQKILVQYPFMHRDNKINYFTSNLPVSSFDTDRKLFLGQNEYGSWANPTSLQQPELNNSEALRGDNMAALLHHLGPVLPGQSRRLITQLGQVENVAAALPGIEQYRQPAAVEAALSEMARFWEDYLSKMQVSTPDEAMNRMLNIHNPRQCYITKNWSRYLSLYQVGLGTARGIGFRDSSQDVLGVMGNAPVEGQALIHQLLHVQKRDGSAMHQFNPLTMQANEGDSREVEDAPKYYSDDHLWIILAVTAYLKETGDLAFLDQVIPYYEKDQQENPLETGLVLDHLRRAIEFTRGDVGQHGLPLLGFADWNDTVNLRAGAESLFTANLYGKALLEIIELSDYLGDAAAVEKYQGYYEEMKQRVNQHAWDGEWYVRYFDFDGTPLGSHANTHGQIYANGQSWPVISGFAPPDRARTALESVYTRLNTRYGIKLSTPGFNGYDPTKGGITTYPPGAKENGGIFLHANPWVMIAETILGNGDRAFEYYHQINPAAQNGRIDEYECEPYVYCQNILGDEHPQFGLARNSWLSGTASWCYQAGTRYILGIRPTYAGLQIDPCIPAAWPGFKVSREFRGARYEINVENPQRLGKGVNSLWADGRRIEGNIAPVFADGQTHQIMVKLGQ
jgi:cellobiose phosphorylase